MPAASGTRVIVVNRILPPNPPIGVTSNKAAGVGSTINASFRIFPLLPRMQWIARITEFEWNRYFADVQVEGPFKRWQHRHEFAGEIWNGVQGTRIRDIVDYEVGFGVFGKVADSAFVRRQMGKTFASRQQTVPKLL